jgi:hypothetical protein
MIQIVLLDKNAFHVRVLDGKIAKSGVKLSEIETVKKLEKVNKMESTCDSRLVGK